MADVHDTPVFGVYATENMDSEDEDEDADVEGCVSDGDEYVSDDDENEERDRDAAEYFGPLEDENVSDGRDIED